MHQVRVAFAILFSVLFLGVFGYMVIEGWSFLDSLYMTVITVTTTGFAEVRPLSPTGRVFTVGMIVLGFGSFAFLGGKAAQVFIESQILRRRRVSKKVESLRDHYIVCGYGRLGHLIAEELHESNIPFVVIEMDPSKHDELIEDNILFVQGDASHDEILLKAGINCARGLVAVVASDAENVYITLSAKVLKPDIYVVTRAIEEETEKKMLRAGADRVVKPYEIGATRMVNLLLRPGIVDFIDVVSNKKNLDLKLEEVIVSKNSPLVNMTLAESPLRSKLNVIVVAIFHQDGDLKFNPAASCRILEGDRLIAIGQEPSLEKLTELCRVQGN